jgi:hypothetical protein
LAWDGINLAEVHIRNESDLALGRLEPIEPRTRHGDMIGADHAPRR